jgi:hypothetical protein
MHPKKGERLPKTTNTAAATATEELHLILRLKSRRVSIDDCPRRSLAEVVVEVV